MNRLFIFDLDGVLFESRDMHFRALNEALVEHGYDPITYGDHVAKYNGLPTREKLVRLGLTVDEIERVNNNKQAFTLRWVCRNVTRDEKLVRLFTDLDDADWKVAVASNAKRLTVVKALQLLGVWSLCDHVASADDVENPKPDPEIYNRCMMLCGSDPLNTWIVEDSPVGVAGARASRAHVVEVAGPQQVEDVVRQIMEAYQ